MKVIAPWRWLVTLESVAIENKLGRRNFTPRQCERVIAFASMQYVPLVHEIINELIKESRGGYGLMISALRNPTLVQLSIQTLFISAVNPDVTQCSLRISDRVIKAPNAKIWPTRRETSSAYPSNCWKLLKLTIPTGWRKSETIRKIAYANQ